jgi:histidine ammonia-lyase
VGDGEGTSPVVLGEDGLTIADYLAVCAGAELAVEEAIWHRIKAAELIFEDLLRAGVTVYGVTTAYGAASGRQILPAEQTDFQMATVRSHACGTGPSLARSWARGVWLAKVLSISTGLTGARMALVESMVALLNAGFAPIVPRTGSLGASGDLIPSGHAALALLGEGQVYRRDGSIVTAPVALETARVSVVELGPRDGLSLVNGTAVTLSLTAHACAETAELLAASEWVAMAGLEALGGHIEAFGSTIVGARAHPGAVATAESVRHALAGVEPARLGRQGLHDPYSWRCLPQVHGAARDACGWASSTCEVELESCTDNPLIADDGAVVSGGNFHSAPLGLTADMLRLAVGEVAALSRQRTAHLAASLAHGAAGGEPVEGVGLTMVLTTATASLMEISSAGIGTGHWLPVDSVEDHVPNSTIAALHALDVLAHARAVLAAEAVATTALLQRGGAAPTSAGARWLSDLSAGIVGTLRLDQPLAHILEAVADALANADFQVSP